MLRRTSLLVLLLSLAIGCGSALFIRRATYVDPNTDVVRLRQPLKNVKVWVVIDPDGEKGPQPPRWEPSVIDIPEGLYVGGLGPDEEVVK